ncbi:hypothetical protein [Sanguibacter suaedae]|uniref:hypothetical protein n=1 Tax=Sanguibacter suaedae TaxID=2795737 RepID=UPI0027DD07AD|nr:hypothetical protein [Sanguibacter suaedae]
MSLLEGPAVLAGILAGGSVAVPPGPHRSALLLATSTAGVFGIVDDLAERGGQAKGLKGHLRAARDGRLTTGVLKVLGIGAGAVLAAHVAADEDGTGSTGRALGVLADGATIAAAANLVNLFDLRPGRALKVSGAVAATLTLATGAPAPAAVLGGVAAAAPGDLGERDMLGDGGANALGAFLGTTLVLTTPRAVRLGALAGLVALTVASERTSFSAVIASTPWLDRADRWGRRPSPEGTAR